MATTSIAGSPLSTLVRASNALQPGCARSGIWINRFSFTLIIALFFAVQTTALSHEVQHVLHQHDAPCGLHIVADQLVMSAAPEPPLTLVLAPATVAVVTSSDASFADPGRSSSARAPPLPA
jgi:hypothetical protein